MGRRRAAADGSEHREMARGLLLPEPAEEEEQPDVIREEEQQQPPPEEIVRGGQERKKRKEKRKKKKKPKGRAREVVEHDEIRSGSVWNWGALLRAWSALLSAGRSFIVALSATLEEEEAMEGKKREEKKCQKRESSSSERRLHTHNVEIVEEKMTMDEEEDHYATWRSTWESKRRTSNNFFIQQTTLSSLHFTHLPPGCGSYSAFVAGTLQIYSFKIAQLKGDLEWPLDVYGVVAARDAVDRNRNTLFCADRWLCQELTQEDPFLLLTGPSRAVVYRHAPIDFEIELKVKGSGKPSEDRALMTRRFRHHRCASGLTTVRLDNCVCTAELSYEQLRDSIQATILGVRVVQEGSSSQQPFEHGGRVACSSASWEVMEMHSQGIVVDDDEEGGTSPRQVVLLDYHGEEMPMGRNGYLHLTRNVVAVELGDRFGLHAEYTEHLKVVVQGYSESGGIAAQGQVIFAAKLSQISQQVCRLGEFEVEVTVAWSLLVEDKFTLFSFYTA